MTLAERSSSRENGFDEIRFAAATAVILSHAFPMAGAKWEIGGWATGFQSLGAYAVYVFFVVSGFLISKSWCDRPQLLDYVKRRAFRIVPGFVAATLFAVLIVGPIATTLPLKDYLKHPQTRDHLWNVLMYKIGYFLPGVFEKNPIPYAVNGSLWSLPVECYMYVAVPVLASVGLLLRSRGRQALVAMTILLFGIDWHWAARPENAVRNIFYLNIPSTMSCVVYFALGAVLYAYRDAVRLSGSLAAAGAGLMLLSFHTPYAKLACFLTLPYLVLWTAYKLPPTPLKRFGDPSYGMYVYAFPIQQLFMKWFPGINWAGNFVLAFVATLGISLLSWRFVEAPCLSLVRKKKQVELRVVPASRAA